MLYKNNQVNKYIVQLYSTQVLLMNEIENIQLRNNKTIKEQEQFVKTIVSIRNKFYKVKTNLFIHFIDNHMYCSLACQFPQVN